MRLVVGSSKLLAQGVCLNTANEYCLDTKLTDATRAHSRSVMGLGRPIIDKARCHGNQPFPAAPPQEYGQLLNITPAISSSIFCDWMGCLQNKVLGQIHIFLPLEYNVMKVAKAWHAFVRLD